jgi:hypothetical protein
MLSTERDFASLGSAKCAVTAGPLAILRLVPLLQKSCETLHGHRVHPGTAVEHRWAGVVNAPVEIYIRGIVSPVSTKSPVVYRYT